MVIRIHAATPDRQQYTWEVRDGDRLIAAGVSDTLCQAVAAAEAVRS